MSSRSRSAHTSVSITDHILVEAEAKKRREWFRWEEREGEQILFVGLIQEEKRSFIFRDALKRKASHKALIRNFVAHSLLAVERRRKEEEEQQQRANTFYPFSPAAQSESITWSNLPCCSSEQKSPSEVCTE